MAKFRKRITKISGRPLQNALVVGEGFGFLTNIVEIFQTVFLINDTKPELKSRNLVFKENSDDLHLLIDISIVFFDKNKINELNLYYPVFTRWKSIVLIESHEPLEREIYMPLLHHGWKVTNLDGPYHVWELK